MGGLILVYGPVVLVVLSDDQIEQIKRHDPVQVNLRKLPALQVPPALFAVVHADASGMERIEDLARTGDGHGAMQYATRGHSQLPDLSDDQPYIAVKPEPLQ